MGACSLSTGSCNFWTNPFREPNSLTSLAELQRSLRRTACWWCPGWPLQWPLLSCGTQIVSFPIFGDGDFEQLRSANVYKAQALILSTSCSGQCPLQPNRLRRMWREESYRIWFKSPSLVTIQKASNVDYLRKVHQVLKGFGHTYFRFCVSCPFSATGTWYSMESCGFTDRIRTFTFSSPSLSEPVKSHRLKQVKMFAYFFGLLFMWFPNFSVCLHVHPSGWPLGLASINRPKAPAEKQPGADRSCLAEHHSGARESFAMEASYLRGEGQNGRASFFFF